MNSFITFVLLGDSAGVNGLECAVISARVQAVCVAVVGSLPGYISCMIHVASC